MTTFQYIIDAIFGAIAFVMPVPEVISQDLYKNLLKWPTSTFDTRLLITLMGSACILVFFRYDWLGLVSAVIKSIIRPMTLKATTRSLDQHTSLFLILIIIPSWVAQKWLLPWVSENEWAQHPFLIAGIFFLIAGLFHFSANWNKRLKGLNHVRLIDGLFIGGLTLFSAHPAISLVFVLWIGFALTNYHYETLFKYSYLILGVHLIIRFFELLHEVSLKSAINTVGHLNSIAILVISTTTFWLILENLEKNLNESMLKTFKWFSILFGLFFVAIYFV